MSKDKVKKKETEKVSKKPVKEKVVKEKTTSVTPVVVKTPRKADDRKFLVVYAGLAGRKALTEEEAKTVGQEYIKAGKCKKFDVYKIVSTVTA